MQHISNQRHNRYTFIYVGSRALEHFAYYGMRALLVLYMIDETIGFSREKALEIYGVFTGALIVSQVVGAIFGDLLLGNKKAIIFGGLAQALGCFALCFPIDFAIYIGIGLMVLGGGFYTPNILSHFGKLYLGKKKLLDSAYTLFYVAINIGAIFGAFAIGSFAENAYTFGFALAGIVALLSVLPLLFFRENKFEYPPIATHKWGMNILMFLLVVLLGATFWKLYDMTGMTTFELQRDITELLKIPTSSLMAWVNPPIIIFFGVGFSVLFSFFFVNRFAKLALGFLLAAGAYGLLLFIPDNIAESHVVFFIGYMVLLGLAEIIIGPTILSMLANYTHPRFLAIAFSLYLMFVKIAILLFSGLFFEEGLTFLSIVSTVLLGGLVILLIIIFIITKATGFKED